MLGGPIRIGAASEILKIIKSNKKMIMVDLFIKCTIIECHEKLFF